MMKKHRCYNSMFVYFLKFNHFKDLCIFICLIIFCICINISIVWGIPPSPAGGNYLTLDGKDDFAFLDFNKFGALFEDNTHEFTVEAWIYPTSAPDNDSIGTILVQQIVMYTVSYDNSLFEEIKEMVDWKEGDLLLGMITYDHCMQAGGLVYLGTKPMTISPYNWHHVAFQIGGNDMASVYDNQIISEGGVAGVTVETVSKLWYKDFVLGGFGQKYKPAFPFFNWWGSFAGYIDDVRISNIPRYDIKEQLTPQGRFESDENTIALWHFDEAIGSTIFLDSSGHSRDLVGKNGATIGDVFEVSEQNKLATTWASIKANRD